MKESGLREGMSAYAFRQAGLQESLANAFGELWKRPVSDWGDDSLSNTDDDADADDLNNWDQIEGMDDEDSDNEVETGD